LQNKTIYRHNTKTKISTHTAAVYS